MRGHGDSGNTNSIAQKHSVRNGVYTNWVLQRRQKELFDELSAQSPLTIISGATRKSVLGMRTQIRGRNPSWRQVFRPCTLGLIGLAISVALWGFGYKLSLYHRHSTFARIPIAKLWIEPRNASVAAASSLSTKSHLIPASQAFPVPIQELPSHSRAAASIFPVCTRDVAYFDFLIPFRSPPQRFSLA